MTFLPVVERELRVASRQRLTYWARFYAVLLALIVFVWIWLATGPNAAPADRSANLFLGISIVAFVYSLFSGVLVTADSISEEKREGTLGLLFLTDLKGYDVVLGKLVANSLNSVYGLVAIFPIMALPFLIGGLTAGEIFRMMLLLVNALVFSLCAGIFASALCRSDRRAQSATFALLLAIVAFPPALAHIYSGINSTPPNPYALMTSLGYGFAVALDLAYQGSSTEYWTVMAVNHALSWLFLLLASLLVPRLWQDRPYGARATSWKSWWQQARLGNPEQRRGYRARLLNITPYFWLASRDRSKPAMVFAFLGLAGVVWFWLFMEFEWSGDVTLYMLTMLLLHLVLKGWVATEAGRLFAEDRRSGALELTLSTPLKVREILAGQLSALLRQFGWPVAIVLFADACMMLAGERRSSPSDTSWTVFWIASMAFLVLDGFTLAWVAMWHGLTSKKSGRVAAQALSRVLALPILAMIFLGFVFRSDAGFGLFYLWLFVKLLNDLAFLFASLKSLNQDFRLVVTQRFDGPGAAKTEM